MTCLSLYLDPTPLVYGEYFNPNIWKIYANKKKSYSGLLFVLILH